MPTRHTLGLHIRPRSYRQQLARRGLAILAPLPRARWGGFDQEEIQVQLPRAIWQKQVRGNARLDFMSEDHHRVRYFVVDELPRVGKPLSSEYIAGELNLSLAHVIGILDDLEQHMIFLFRNEGGEVTWAYPVTVDHTPHHMTFSTGESVNAA